jgi:hypothetical protein
MGLLLAVPQLGILLSVRFTPDEEEEFFFFCGDLVAKGSADEPSSYMFGSRTKDAHVSDSTAGLIFCPEEIRSR